MDDRYYQILFVASEHNGWGVIKFKYQTTLSVSRYSFHEWESIWL
jgi:hypothetical protein